MGQVTNHKNKKNIIPIALSTDNNYIFPTIVTITSILENAAPLTYYDIYILLSSDFNEESKYKLLKIKDHYQCCNITLINMKDEFKDINVNKAIPGPAISTPTYYRLKLASILSHLNKILYLDVDIIVLNDLLKLYETNIESYYVAGVVDLDTAIIRGNKYTNNIGIKDSSQYINAGVLLMNLEKIRNDEIEKKFEEFINKNKNNKKWQWHDQDVINSVCYNMIYTLPYKFNVMIHQFSKINIYKVLAKKNFYAEALKKAFKSPEIIHYSGIKPWSIYVTSFSPIWWDYAKKSLSFDEIKHNYNIPYQVLKLLHK